MKPGVFRKQSPRTRTTQRCFADLKEAKPRAVSRGRYERSELRTVRTVLYRALLREMPGLVPSIFYDLAYQELRLDIPQERTTLIVRVYETTQPRSTRGSR